MKSKLLYLGVVAYDNLLKLLNIASVHVYLTYLVLSWSVLEAMALENIIVGSKTEPVEEVIKHNKNGLLVDFFDYDQIVETVNNTFSATSQKYNQIRKNARKTIIDNYDLKKVSIPKQMKIVEEMLK